MTSTINKTKLTRKEWEEIQGYELGTWCDKAFGSMQEKLVREIDRQREMIVIFDLREYVKEISGTFLDVGCGPYSILNNLYTDANLIGVDPLVGSYIKAGHEMNAHKVKYIRAKAEELPFDNNVMDLVISTNSIDHFEDPEKGINEMVRVLKPNGLLFLQTTIDNTINNPHPCHKIDLNSMFIVGLPQVRKMGIVSIKEDFYGYRRQLAFYGIFRKI